MSGRIWAMPVAPVTGDADRVVVMAQRFGSTAETIRAASRSLRALDDGGSSSDAVDAFLAKAATLAAQMARAEGRYEVAGDALSAYARVLAVAQEPSARAVRDHRGATDDHDVQHRQAEKFRGQAMLEPEGESKRWLEDQARLHQSRSDDARTRVAALGGVIDEAHAEVAAAAALAISRLDGASGDGLRDSVFDEIGGAVDAAYEGFQVWMEDNDKWISDVVDVASFAGVVLMGVALFIPGVNIAAVLVAALVLALTTARAAAGTGTWGEVAVALLSVALVGSGAAVGKGLRQAAGTLRSARTSQLIEAGVSPSFAKAWVGRMWSRSRPGALNRSLFRSMGDPAVAQIARFARPPRATVLVDDVVLVADITRRLNVMRAIQGAGNALGIGERVSSIYQDIGRPRGALMAGASW
jgi:hypothetical protein